VRRPSSVYHVISQSMSPHLSWHRLTAVRASLIWAMCRRKAAPRLNGDQHKSRRTHVVGKVWHRCPLSCTHRSGCMCSVLAAATQAQVEVKLNRRWRWGLLPGRMSRTAAMVLWELLSTCPCAVPSGIYLLFPCIIFAPRHQAWPCVNIW